MKANLGGLTVRGFVIAAILCAGLGLWVYSQFTFVRVVPAKDVTAAQVQQLTKDLQSAQARLQATEQKLDELERKATPPKGSSQPRFGTNRR